MANNPLLGNRISLISKKNIRYEGTLYSINEADATVALADVRSYGTEGREKLDPNAAYVPVQDAVHPYLLFRGCDIKDLHVHEKKEAQPVGTPSDPAIVSTEVPPDLQAKQQQQQQQQASSSKDVSSSNSKPSRSISRDKKAGNDGPNSSTSSSSMKQNGSMTQQRQTNGKNGYFRRPRKHDTQIGTGASLLNRKARGAVGNGLAPATGKDFDFESSAAEFDKEKESTEEDDNVVAISDSAYNKDDFFDSISCDAIDKRDGVDNRLRGAAERNLNTETFGAVSLGNGRRGGRRNRNGRGGGRGGRGGRHGRGDYGPPSRENSRWKRTDEGSKPNRSNHFAQPPTMRAGGER